MRKDTHETPVERTSTLVLRNLRALDDRPPDPVSSGQGLRARLVHVRGRVECRSDEASDRSRDEIVSERLALGLEGQDGEGVGCSSQQEERSLDSKKAFNNVPQPWGGKFEQSGCIRSNHRSRGRAYQHDPPSVSL